jgi:small-conductance mechanosensitive channel
MEPIMSLAAGAILKLAVDEAVKAGAGEGAKLAVGGAADLAKQLWAKIKTRFQGDARAEKAIQAVEAEQSQPAITKLETYLDDAMTEDPAFATEIQQMAQQILNIQNQNTTTLNQQNLNYGRDQNIINQPQGDIRIGGS